jgi:prophage regulatory protein
MATENSGVMREDECFRESGLSRPQRWRLERVGKFPKRIQLSANSVGWLRHEVKDWIATRIAQRAPVDAVSEQAGVARLVEARRPPRSPGRPRKEDVKAHGLNHQVSSGLSQEGIRRVREAMKG